MSLGLAVFVAAGLLLVVAGTVQTRSAASIAELTGLGRLWVVVLMAFYLAGLLLLYTYAGHSLGRAS